MNENRSILSKYFEILEESRSSKYLHCKTVSGNFDKSESTDELWKKHDKINKKVAPVDNISKQSLLDLKIEIASRIFKACCFCERRCGVNRTIKYGNCGVMQARVSSEFLHLGEESVLVPYNKIFF
jgi:putative pyruvate formate lyase activating enzyme